MKYFASSLALSAALAFSPAHAFDLTSMSDAERSAFRAEIKSYLMENPEIIMEAVAVLEERQAQEQVANDAALVKANADDLFADANSWSGGNPDGDITMVEFVDYRCSYCRKAHDEVAELIKSDGNIRFIVKEFPILGQDSVTSSRFAIATRIVEGDDAYKQVSDALIKLRTGVEPPVLKALADSLGLDASTIMAKMESDEVTQIIAENRSLGQRLGISGTPTFVMGDMVLRGYMPLAQMQNIAGSLRNEQ